MINKLGILPSVIFLSLFGITAVSAQCESIGQPRDFQLSILQNTALVAQWTADEHQNNCNVTYSFSIYENDVLTQGGDTIHTQFFASWGGPCTNTVALLYAKIGSDVTSIPAVTSLHTCVRPGFAQVTGLTLTPIRNEARYDVLVQWAPPTGFSGCIITYKLTIDDNPPIILEGTEHTIPLLENCDSTVSVVPIVDDVEGIAVSSVMPISPGLIGPVLSLSATIIDNIFIATWAKPAGFEKCKNLSYYIELWEAWQIVGIVWDATTATEWRWNVSQQCPGGKLHMLINPRHGDVSGEATTVEHECP